MYDVKYIYHKSNGDLFIEQKSVISILDNCINDFEKSVVEEGDFKESIVALKAFKEVFLRDMDKIVVKKMTETK